MKLAIKYQNWIIAGYIIALILLSIVSFNGDLAPNKKHVVGIRTDYIIHALFFIPWMILANLRWNQNNYGKVFLSVLGIGLVLAVVSEIVQLLIPRKAFNPIDLAANGVGIIVGTMIWFLLSCLGKRRKK
ncbi:MAG: VanZ family protein [Syntrophaceae bacterium]|nr:VanZ family protein [Syntrophaceae bacterium]